MEACPVSSSSDRLVCWKAAGEQSSQSASSCRTVLIRLTVRALWPVCCLPHLQTLALSLLRQPPQQALLLLGSKRGAARPRPCRHGLGPKCRGCAGECHPCAAAAGSTRLLLPLGRRRTRLPPPDCCSALPPWPAGAARHGAACRRQQRGTGRPWRCHCLPKRV